MTTSTPPVRQGLSAGEAATQLGVSERTVRRWIKKGKLPASRVEIHTGFTYRIAPEALQYVHGVRQRDVKVSDQPVSVGPSDGPVSDHDDPAGSDQVDQANGAAKPGTVTNVQQTAQELVALVRELTQEHQRIVQEKDEQIIQLSGQVGFLQAQVQEKDKQIKLLQPPPEKPRRRWWRRLWPMRRRNTDVYTSDGREQATGDE